MDEIERIEEERFVESLICLWIQPDAPEWIIDFVRQELRKQRGLSKKQKALTISQIYRDGFGNKISYCPICNARIQFDANHRYCGFCGQEVKWE